MTLIQEAEFAPRIFTPEELEEIVRIVQEKHGLGDDFFETARCESSNFIDQEIQSGYYKNGVRENSWGIFQFNLPSGLKTAEGEIITKEIAIDPYQAAEAAAFNFKQGLQGQWTCWKGKGGH